MLFAPRRQTGWKPDPDDSRDVSFEKLGLVRASYAATTLKPYVVEILDQGSTNSCVAHAWEQAYRIRQGIAGGPWFSQWGKRLGSRLFGYRNSRRTHGEEHLDEGTYLRTYAKAVNVFGRPPEEAWPFIVRKVNALPAWNAYRLAFDSSGPQSYYRIDSFGEERARAVQAALSDRRPVVFGARIGAAFTQLGPTTRPVPPTLDPAKWIGGHAMCLVGYDANGDFEVVNSWSPSWGNKGYAKLSRSWVTWTGSDDFWVVG